jgi:NADH-quinone oxidoreductase subunit F
VTIEERGSRRDQGGGGRPVEARVCCGSRCVAQGALEVLDRLRGAANGRVFDPGVDVRAGITGCRGFCSQGPLVHFPGADILYCRVEVADVEEIVEHTIAKGQPVERLLPTDPVTGRKIRGLADNPFFTGQDRRVLARCGVIDPESIGDAVAHGAYHGLRRAVAEVDPAGIIDAVKRSGLQERGAQGFPVGLKWSLVAESPSETRYVIGNGEGGDPASGIDRLLLEGDPHAVIEGMVIAGIAVGARQGKLVIRSEHSLAVARTQRAVAEAGRRGFLGSGILGSTFDFSIEIHESAGASTGGEETALLNSLQGQRAVARPRPPFPSASGLWGRPTLINGLETLANIPLIIGTVGGEDAVDGRTKIVDLSGAVARPGLAEVTLGVPVETIVREIGGGCGEGRRTAAIHIGGPAGATIGPDHFDTPFDYGPLRDIGLNLGSGGLVALDTPTCVVSFARYLVELSAAESCGTCPPCRIGMRVLINLLDRVRSGAGDLSDLHRMERLCHHIRRTSMCELGRNAANPVISGLQHFRQQYEAHVTGGGCSIGECRASPVDDSPEESSFSKS